jgi:hypothetical protein
LFAPIGGPWATFIIQARTNTCKPRARARETCAKSSDLFLYFYGSFLLFNSLLDFLREKERKREREKERKREREKKRII